MLPSFFFLSSKRTPNDGYAVEVTLIMAFNYGLWIYVQPWLQDTYNNYGRPCITSPRDHVSGHQGWIQNAPRVPYSLIVLYNLGPPSATSPHVVPLVEVILKSGKN